MSIVFETERLIARQYLPSDADACYRIYRDPEVWRWLGGGLPHEDIERSRAAIERYRRRYLDTPGYGSWAVVVRDTAQVIGTVLLARLEDGPEIELGYHLGQFAWGHGYATEIARGAIQYGFETLELPQMCGVVFPENLASQRVLEKAGMTYRGMRVTFGFDLMHYTIEPPSLQPG
jgi:ribosomal-protein-alanine N-acetyltransferase